MRNWNVDPLTVILDGDTGSQPTYEELKPSWRGIGNYPSLGSQPTYEELKPGIAAAADPFK